MPACGSLLIALRGWSLERDTPTGPRAVLRDIDLELRAGRWLAVVGANGSGKSSLLKFLASADSPLADRAAIMFQDPDEQIFAGGVDREIGLGRAHLDVAAVRAEFGLEGLGALNPSLLSAGQKQRLVLAVALGAKPDVLLCDEPTSLQDPTQTRWVLDRLDAWRCRTAGALVTATCDRHEAARADDILLLADGRVAASGPAAVLLDDPRVQSLLDARPASGPAGPVCGPPDSAPLLELTDVGLDFADGGSLEGVDLTVRAGDRWGLVGDNGCGKSTLLAMCAGARRPERGRVTLAGRRLFQGRGLDLDHGQSLLAPQFPEYLFTRSDVAAEIGLDPALGRDSVADFLTRVGLPPSLSGENPHDLSSGQRRRLALGLVLRAGRPLVLLDEPTAALDAAGKARILDLIGLLPRSAALVVASHDREFLAAAGCRLLQLDRTGATGGRAR